MEAKVRQKNLEVKKIYRLSPMQEGMLFHAVLDRNSTAYFEQFTLTVAGDLQADLLEESFNRLIARYDILKTNIVHENVQKPHQVVLTERRLAIFFKDLSCEDAYRKNYYLEEYKSNDRNTGFDLKKDLLMRVAVFKFQQNVFKLVWSFHHVLMDGWCIGILSRELLQIYSALKENRPLHLAEPRQYHQFIQWLEKQDHAESGRYWRQALQGYEKPVSLPDSALTGRVNKHLPREAVFTLEERVTQGLTVLAKSYQVTLNAVLQTIWGILLQKYNHCTDVVFGCVVAGRPPELAGIETMVGLFINTLPLRIKCDQEASFSAVLKQTQESITRMGPHTWFPLYEIQAQVKNRLLFDYTITFVNYPIGKAMKNQAENRDALAIKEVEVFEHSNYGFNITIVPGNQLTLKIMYNGLQYSPELIRRIVGHITRTAEQVIRQPDIPVQNLEILSEAEKNRLLYQFNKTGAFYPHDKTIYELFHSQAEKTPAAAAAVHNERHMSYRELDQRSNQLAHFLRKQGVGPDSIVAILASNSPEFIIAILGVLKAGGAYLPIDPSYPDDRIRYMLDDSGSRQVLTDDPAKTFTKTQTVILLTDQAIDQENDLPLDPVNKPQDPAYIIYTSGSTGKPKGVMVTHRGLVNYIWWAAKVYLQGEKLDFPLYSSISFDLTVTSLFTPLLTGGSVIVYEGEDKALLVRKIVEEDRAGILKLTPTHLQLLEDMNWHKKRLKKLIVGGEDLKTQLAAKIDANSQGRVQIYNEYGPTETVVGCMIYRYQPERDRRDSVPIGVPADNVRIYLLDAGLKPVPMGVPGELYIGGDGVARGYLNRPELTAARFVDNPFIRSEKMYKTGDLARMLDDGNIEFLGRMDEQVKIRGCRIELGEIEAKLRDHPGIKEAVVTVEQENRLCAYLVTRREIADIQAYLAGSLPGFMLPDAYIKIDRLPLTPNGKLDKKALAVMGRSTAGDGQSASGREINPDEPDRSSANEMEKKLVEIWQQVLEKENIGVCDNFFELGGHSLKAMSLLGRIYKEFNVQIPLEKMFEKPTVKDLAASIAVSQQESYPSIPPAEKRAYYPASSAQKRIYILTRLVENGTVYNVPGAVLIAGKLDRDRLTRVFSALIKRHEALRTSFTLIDGEPVQRIHDKIEFHPDYRETAEEHLQQVIAESVLPFDLSQPPLLRVRLLKTGEDRHVLFYDMHHIISDGVSMDIIIREFFELYRGKKLPELRLQYKDYTLWQKKLFETGSLQKQKDYWLSIFQEDIPVLNLPADFKRPAVQSFAGGSAGFMLDDQLADQLKVLAAQTGTTVYMTLFAVFNILLMRYSGQEDLVVGTLVEGRPHTDLENILGIFINTLAIRSRPLGHKTFKAFLAEIKTNLLCAYQNQDYQFEELVETLDIRRDKSRNPLFDVMCVWQNNVGKGIDTGGLQLKSLTIEKKISKFDLIMVAEEVKNGIYIFIEFCTRLFRKSTIEQMCLSYLNLLQDALTNPETRLADLELLPPAEKDKLVQAYNATAMPFPETKTVHQLFEEQAARTPERIALVFEHQHWTYLELNRQANRIARLLRQKGLKPGNIAAIMTERSLEMAAGILGILKAGGAYLPVDPAYPQARVRYLLEDSGASILLTTEKGMKDFSFTALLTESSDPVKLKITAPRMPIEDFNSLPIPDRSLADYEKYQPFIGIAMVKNTIAIQATRGCPYQCAYCHKIWPKNHVTRSAENIFSEVRLYYEMGIRKFVFIDDIFNLDTQNSTRFFQLIIRNRMKIQLFFPNGVRGDILTPEYIDLMVEAGTVNMALALETASPRLQKLIKKNLKLDRLRENITYITAKYPQVILDLFAMHGFPSETEEEAQATLDFIKSIRWLHFPYYHILKIFPGTDMAAWAKENGVTEAAIARSMNLAFHELPDTLPFPKTFTQKCQMEFLNEYFLSRERLRRVLPRQMQILTEDELVQKYNSYLPARIEKFADLLSLVQLTKAELGNVKFQEDTYGSVIDFNWKVKTRFPARTSDTDALRILILDLSQLFAGDTKEMLYDVAEPPLGPLYLLTYLNHRFGPWIKGKIAKSRIDFNSFQELKVLIDEFQPHLIGIRTLSFYRDFFHKTVSVIRQWGVTIPVIAGGPYATSDFTGVLQDRQVDLVVLGEGEVTLAELAGYMLENGYILPERQILERINGIVFREAEEKSISRQVLWLDLQDDNEPVEPAADPESPATPESLLYMIYTSGTSGKPKGVKIRHRSFVNLLHWFTDQFAINETDKNLLIASISFDLAQKNLFAPLMKGGELHLSAPGGYDCRRLAEIIDRQKITLLNCTPSAFYPLLELCREAEYRPLAHLKYLFLGGEPINQELLMDWLQSSACHAQVVNTYGPTECTDITSFHILKTGNADPLKPVPIGKPIFNASMYILDKNRNLVPPGVAGELYIGGIGVGAGYHGPEELTTEKFLTLPQLPETRIYKTGDLARWTETGDAEYLGRADFQIKIRGFRIEPGEIESSLLKNQAIKEAAVIAREDSRGDGVLYAYLTADKALSIPELRTALGDELPVYMMPAYFIQLEKMPLSPNGKIDRKILATIGNTGDVGTVYAAPSNVLEARLIDVWREVLGLETVGVADNFFESGGHSLKAMSLLTRLHKEMQVEIELIDIFNHPTVRELAAFVKGKDRSGFAGIVPAPESDYYPMSSAQARIYVLQMMDTGGTAYNTPQVYTIRGEVDRDRLNQVLQTLIKRHEILRTSFHIVDGEPVQKVHEDAVFRMDYTEADGSMIRAGIHGFIKPFDLKQPPLLRVRLTRLTDGRHLLMFDLHHIIADAVSMNILTSEFFELYGGKKLPGLRVHYKDYSVWQKRSLGSDRMKQQETFWLEQFSGELPVLNLPTDFPRPASRSFIGGRIRFHADPVLTGRIQSLMRQTGTTLHMVLLAAYTILLARYTCQEDIVIGSPIPGRSHADLEKVLGMFVNMLALRNFPRPFLTFTEFLAEVKENALKAYQHPDMQFDLLVEKLNASGDLSRNPLFDVTLSILSVDTREGADYGLKLVPYEEAGLQGTAKYDLSLEAAEENDRILFSLGFSTELYKKETIQVLAGHFIHILTEVAQNPGIALSAIEMLSDEERQQLLTGYQQPEKEKTGTGNTLEDEFDF